MIHLLFIKLQNFKINSINIKIWTLILFKYYQMISKECYKLIDYVYFQILNELFFNQFKKRIYFLL
jgi:hypothetical protein